MADHNDPNAVNSIFSDIDVSAADLYDIFGFPGDDRAGIEKVVIALTFAAVPQTGVFDADMLYRILIAPDHRIARWSRDDTSLAGLLAYLEAIKEKYLKILKPSEVRVMVDHNNRANLSLHRLSRRKFFGLRSNQRECQRAIARRTSDRRLCRRTRRRLLQRSAGLLPIDQLCPAILSRSPYDAGCA
jgi:hypothetical protein